MIQVWLITIFIYLRLYQIKVELAIRSFSPCFPILDDFFVYPTHVYASSLITSIHFIFVLSLSLFPFILISSIFLATSLLFFFSEHSNTFNLFSRIYKNKIFVTNTNNKSSCPDDLIKFLYTKHCLGWECG